MSIFENELSVNTFYVIGVSILIVVTLVISIYNMYRIRMLIDKYNKFMKNLEGRNLEESLERFMKRVEEVYEKSLRLENHANEIDRTLLKCFQKVGVVRYSAFEDVGSDLSFVIALLDGNDNGFVINGIYSREGCSTYAKPIINGKSKYTLSAEELQALDAAKKGFR